MARRAAIISWSAAGEQLLGELAASWRGLVATVDALLGCAEGAER